MAHDFEPVFADALVPQQTESVPAGMCGFAHRTVSLVNEILPTVALFATSCDQMRRAAEWTAMHSDVPVFLMHMPATWNSEASLAYYKDELRRLGRFLVDTGGRNPARTDLRYAMNDGRTSRADPVPDDTALALMLIGGPSGAEARELDHWLGHHGARIVMDATDFSERTRPAGDRAISEAADPLDALASAYFMIPDPSRRPDFRFHDYVSREVKKRGIRGIIVRHYVWCDTWALQEPRLRETAGVPVLSLEVEGSPGLDGRTQSRLAAFLEMLRGNQS